MLKILIKPLSIMIPMALGLVIPGTGNFSFLIPYLIIFMIFWSTLKINPKRMKILPVHWKILFFNLIMGIIPFYLIRMFGESMRPVAEAAFFCGIAPTATAAPVIITFLKGKIEPVLTGFLLTNAAISIALLFLLPLTVGTFSASFLNRTVINLLVLAALPMILAALVRRFFPSFLLFAEKYRTIPFYIWSLVLFLVTGTARIHFEKNPHLSVSLVLLIAVVSLIICFLNFLIGRKLSREYSRECSQLLGQKNTAFVIYLALMFGTSPLSSFGPIFYVIWHNTWNAWQIFMVARHPGDCFRRRKYNHG